MPKDVQKIHDEIQEVRQKKIYRVQAAQDMWPVRLYFHHRCWKRDVNWMDFDRPKLMWPFLQNFKVGEVFDYIQIV